MFSKVFAVAQFCVKIMFSLIIQRICLPRIILNHISEEACFMETKWNQCTCILEPHQWLCLCNPKHEKAGKSSLLLPVVYSKELHLKLAFCLSSLHSCSLVSHKSMAENIDLFHKYVAEAASKNDFKIFGN